MLWGAGSCCEAAQWDLPWWELLPLGQKRTAGARECLMRQLSGTSEQPPRLSCWSERITSTNLQKPL